MKYLLDTHILLWAVILDKRLPKVALELMKRTDVEIGYSVICSWELAIKEAKSKLRLPSNFFIDLPNLGFDCLNITETHVQTLRDLPPINSDPFDRMLVAQAKTENMTLITSDKRLAEYPVKLLIC